MTENNIVVHPIEIGPMKNLAYFLSDEISNKTLLVDPGWDSNNLIQYIEKHQYHLSGILLTHSHYDHTMAVQELVNKYSCPVYISKHEPLILSSNPWEQTPPTINKDRIPNLVLTSDNQELTIGPFHIRCLHTPGHTPGGQCFLIKNNLFTGDTLFLDECGRCDLPGSSWKAMVSSLQKLCTLDDCILVHPGHKYHTKMIDTLGSIKKSNSVLIKFCS